jgi:hypothetical protein
MAADERDPQTQRVAAMSEPPIRGRFRPGNSYRFKPDAPPPSARDKLRTAWRKHQEEEDRLTGLETALERCNEEGRNARRALREAAAVLGELRHADRSDIAFRYANSETLEQTHAGEVQAAEVARWQREIARLDEIEAALAEEIKQSQSRLGFDKSALRDRLSEVICSSPEFQSLFAALDALHARERGLHKVFRLIGKEIGGLPYECYTRLNQRTSLDPDVNEPIDLGLAELWSGSSPNCAAAMPTRRCPGQPSQMIRVTTSRRRSL